MNRAHPVLALIVPCYNEEEALPSTIPVLVNVLESLRVEGHIAEGSRIILIDDGSRDGSWGIIEQYAAKDPRVRGFKLSFNAGTQGALMAGMMESREELDCIISIDADLQQDLSVIPEMLHFFAQGMDIVAGVRKNRAGDSRVKRIFSDLFYRVMKNMGTPVIEQHSDFRLLGRNVLDALSCYPERNLFLRGIIGSIGFQTTTIFYIQKEREHGDSKYSYWKLFSLAWNGITSFSPIPLRISAVLSLLTLLWAFIVAITTLINYFLGNPMSGWASQMLTTLFLGGIQLFCIAVLGEYTAKIYKEVKHRPYYIIEKKTEDSSTE